MGVKVLAGAGGGHGLGVSGGVGDTGHVAASWAQKWVCGSLDGGAFSCYGCGYECRADCPLGGFHPPDD